MSLGNDVVDLADPETRLADLHPRWVERVFTPRERAALEASPSRHRLHWALWAAKESAYKARKRLDPQAVFSPRAFEVELQALPAAAGVAVGRVLHRGEAFSLEVRLEDAFVHAVATAPGEAGDRRLSRVERARGTPGLAARELAADALGDALGLDRAGFRLAGRAPVARHPQHPVDVEVSLSHHGRFVALACRLPSRKLTRV